MNGEKAPAESVLTDYESAAAHVNKIYAEAIRAMGQDELYPRETAQFQIHLLGNIAFLLVETNRMLAELIAADKTSRGASGDDK